eukprot:2633859-Karenia_brevis.AAC.1
MRGVPSESLTMFNFWAGGTQGREFFGSGSGKLLRGVRPFVSEEATCSSVDPGRRVQGYRAAAAAQRSGFG